MHIGERIEVIMQKKGLNQKQLSEKVKINTSVLNRMIKGTRPVHHNEIAMFSSVLNVSSDYLIGQLDNPSTDDELPSLTIKDKHGIEKEYDPISHLNKKFEELGIKDAGFYDYDKWKNLNREEVEEVIKHFEYVVHKAEERKRDKNN